MQNCSLQPVLKVPRDSVLDKAANFPIGKTQESVKNMTGFLKLETKALKKPIQGSLCHQSGTSPFSKLWQSQAPSCLCLSS